MKSAAVAAAASKASLASNTDNGGENSNAGRARLLSHLISDESSRHQQQSQNRLDLPRPLTAKRRLSGAHQETAAAAAAAAQVPVGVEKPTIASRLRSSVGGINVGSNSTSGLLGIVGDTGPRRRSQRIAPLLPFRLRSQQIASNDVGNGTGNSETGGVRFGRLSNPRQLSGVARGGGGAGRATNLCYYSGGAGAFGRNGVGIGAPYLPKSAALQARRGSNAGSRRASNSSGVGILLNGNGGGNSTPGSRRSSQASIRSQGSNAGGGGAESGRKKASKAPVPTMLIDVQIQLPQSRHWPKWQRDRIANSLFGNRPGEEQWITLDQLDEKMRQLLLLRPQSAGKEATPAVGIEASDEDSESASTSRRRQRNQHRRASLRSRSPSPNGSKGSEGYQQQALQPQQQQLLLRIKARQPATERQLTRRRPSFSLAATATEVASAVSAKQHYHQQTSATTAQLASGVARRRGSHANLVFPHRWPSARPTSSATQNTTTVSTATAAGATTTQYEQRVPARQDLNIQAAATVTSTSQTKVGESVAHADNDKTTRQQHPARRFHKVGLGRARAGRLLKTVSEQRFSFLGAAAGGGRRGSTVTAIAAAASAGTGSSTKAGSTGNETKNVNRAGNGIKLAANHGGGGRICGDDPYTSQLRNSVHNTYYNPGPVDAAEAAANNSQSMTVSKTTGGNTSSTKGSATATAAAAGLGTATTGKGVASLTHSISTPSIVIDVAGSDDIGSGIAVASSGASTDTVSVFGQSTLTAASALRGRKAPVQSLLQVPGFY